MPLIRGADPAPWQPLGDWWRLAHLHTTSRVVTATAGDADSVAAAFELSPYSKIAGPFDDRWAEFLRTRAVLFAFVGDREAVTGHVWERHSQLHRGRRIDTGPHQRLEATQ